MVAPWFPGNTTAIGHPSAFHNEAGGTMMPKEKLDM